MNQNLEKGFLDVAVDPDGKGLVRAGREVRDDDLVEGQAERQQTARQQGCPEHRQGDAAERLPAVRPEIHGRFLEGA